MEQLIRDSSLKELLKYVGAKLEQREGALFYKTKKGRWAGTEKKIETKSDLLNIIYHYIEYGRSLRNPTKNKAYSTLGGIALLHREFYLAVECYQKTGKSEKLRETAVNALEDGDAGSLYEASRAYNILRDLEGVHSVIKAAIGQGIAGEIENYLPDELCTDFYAKLDGYCKRHGFDPCVKFPLAKSINAAFNLVPKYDLGIGVAKGGLYSSFLFSLFGLKTYTVEVHNHNGEGILKIENLAPEKLEGKRVLVLDKDVVSGNTLKLVAEALGKMRASAFDVFLSYNPVCESGASIGSVVKNVPKQFGNVFYPALFGYDRFVEALETLEEKLKS